MLISKFHVHNQAAAQIKHPDTEGKREPFRKFSHGCFKHSLGSTSNLLSLVLTIKYLRSTQDLVGWVLPTYLKVPQVEEGSRAVGKAHGHLRAPRGLVGCCLQRPENCCCLRRSLTGPSQQGLQDPLFGDPLTGAAPCPSQEPFNHERLQGPLSGIPSQAPFGCEVLRDPLIPHLPWSRASGQPGSGPA